MILSEDLPGKRFLISKREFHLPKSRERRSSSSAAAVVLGQKNQEITSEYEFGTIRSCNVPASETTQKKLKLWVQYDSAKENIKEIKPHKCRKQFLVEFLLIEVSHSGKRIPALVFRSVFSSLDEDNLAVIQHFGSRIIVKVPKSSLFPFKFKESKRDSEIAPYVLDDFASWLNIKKTQLFLTKGPYSLTSIRVSIYSDKDGHKYEASVRDHLLLEKKLIVMESVGKTHEVNPSLSQFEFLCSDADLNKLLLGEVPRTLSGSRHTKTQTSSASAVSPMNWVPPNWMNDSTRYSELLSIFKERTKPTSVIKANPRKSRSSMGSIGSIGSSSSSGTEKKKKNQNSKMKKNSMLNAENIKEMNQNSSEDEMRNSRLLRMLEATEDADLSSYKSHNVVSNAIPITKPCESIPAVTSNSITHCRDSSSLISQQVPMPVEHATRHQKPSSSSLQETVASDNNFAVTDGSKNNNQIEKVKTKEDTASQELHESQSSSQNMNQLQLLRYMYDESTAEESPDESPAKCIPKSPALNLSSSSVKPLSNVSITPVSSQTAPLSNVTITPVSSQTAPLSNIPITPVSSQITPGTSSSVISIVSSSKPRDQCTMSKLAVSQPQISTKNDLDNLCLNVIQTKHKTQQSVKLKEISSLPSEKELLQAKVSTADNKSIGCADSSDSLHLNDPTSTSKYKESTKVTTEYSEEIEDSGSQSVLKKKTVEKTIITHTFSEEIVVSDSSTQEPTKPDHEEKKKEAKEQTSSSTKPGKKLSSWEKRKNPKCKPTLTPDYIKSIIENTSPSKYSEITKSIQSSKPTIETQVYCLSFRKTGMCQCKNNCYKLLCDAAVKNEKEDRNIEQNSYNSSAHSISTHSNTPNSSVHFQRCEEKDINKNLYVIQSIAEPTPHITTSTEEELNRNQEPQRSECLYSNMKHGVSVFANSITKVQNSRNMQADYLKQQHNLNKLNSSDVVTGTSTSVKQHCTWENMTNVSTGNSMLAHPVNKDVNQIETYSSFSHPQDIASLHRKSATPESSNFQDNSLSFTSILADIQQQKSPNVNPQAIQMQETFTMPSVANQQSNHFPYDQGRTSLVPSSPRSQMNYTYPFSNSPVATVSHQTTPPKTLPPSLPGIGHMLQRSTSHNSLLPTQPKKSPNRRRSKELYKILVNKRDNLEYKSILCLQAHIENHKLKRSQILRESMNDSSSACRRNFYHALSIAESLPKLPLDGETVGNAVHEDDPTVNWERIVEKLSKFNDECIVEFENRSRKRSTSTVNVIQNVNININPIQHQKFQQVFQSSSTSQQQQFYQGYGYQQTQLPPGRSLSLSDIDHWQLTARSQPFDIATQSTVPLHNQTSFNMHTVPHKQRALSQTDDTLSPNILSGINNILPEGYHLDSSITNNQQSIAHLQQQLNSFRHVHSMKMNTTEQDQTKTQYPCQDLNHRHENKSQHPVGAMQHFDHTKSTFLEKTHQPEANLYPSYQDDRKSKSNVKESLLPIQQPIESDNIDLSSTISNDFLDSILGNFPSMNNDGQIEVHAKKKRPAKKVTKSPQMTVSNVVSSSQTPSVQHAASVPSTSHTVSVIMNRPAENQLRCDNHKEKNAVVDFYQQFGNTLVTQSPTLCHYDITKSSVRNTTVSKNPEVEGSDNVNDMVDNVFMTSSATENEPENNIKTNTNIAPIVSTPNGDLLPIQSSMADQQSSAAVVSQNTENNKLISPSQRLAASQSTDTTNNKLISPSQRLKLSMQKNKKTPVAESEYGKISKLNGLSKVFEVSDIYEFFPYQKPGIVRCIEVIDTDQELFEMMLPCGQCESRKTVSTIDDMTSKRKDSSINGECESEIVDFTNIIKSSEIPDETLTVTVTTTTANTTPATLTDSVPVADIVLSQCDKTISTTASHTKTAIFTTQSPAKTTTSTTPSLSETTVTFADNIISERTVSLPSVIETDFSASIDLSMDTVMNTNPVVVSSIAQSSSIQSYAKPNAVVTTNLTDLDGNKTHESSTSFSTNTKTYDDDVFAAMPSKGEHSSLNQPPTVKDKPLAYNTDFQVINYKGIETSEPFNNTVTSETSLQTNSETVPATESDSNSALAAYFEQEMSSNLIISPPKMGICSEAESELHQLQSTPSNTCEVLLDNLESQSVSLIDQIQPTESINSPSQLSKEIRTPSNSFSIHNILNDFSTTSKTVPIRLKVLPTPHTKSTLSLSRKIYSTCSVPSSQEVAVSKINTTSEALSPQKVTASTINTTSELPPLQKIAASMMNTTPEDLSQQKIIMSPLNTISELPPLSAIHSIPELLSPQKVAVSSIKVSSEVPVLQEAVVSIHTTSELPSPQKVDVSTVNTTSEISSPLKIDVSTINTTSEISSPLKIDASMINATSEISSPQNVAVSTINTTSETSSPLKTNASTIIATSEISSLLKIDASTINTTSEISSLQKFDVSTINATSEILTPLKVNVSTIISKSELTSPLKIDASTINATSEISSPQKFDVSTTHAASTVSTPLSISTDIKVKPTLKKRKLSKGHVNDTELVSPDLYTLPDMQPKVKLRNIMLVSTASCDISPKKADLLSTIACNSMTKPIVSCAEKSASLLSSKPTPPSKSVNESRRRASTSSLYSTDVTPTTSAMIATCTTSLVSTTSIDSSKLENLLVCTTPKISACSTKSVTSVGNTSHVIYTVGITSAITALHTTLAHNKTPVKLADSTIVLPVSSAGETLLSPNSYKTSSSASGELSADTLMNINPVVVNPSTHSSSIQSYTKPNVVVTTNLTGVSENMTIGYLSIPSCKTCSTTISSSPIQKQSVSNQPTSTIQQPPVLDASTILPRLVSFLTSSDNQSLGTSTFQRIDPLQAYCLNAVRNNYLQSANKSNLASAGSSRVHHVSRPFIPTTLLLNQRLKSTAPLTLQTKYPQSWYGRANSTPVSPPLTSTVSKSQSLPTSPLSSPTPHNKWNKIKDESRKRRSGSSDEQDFSVELANSRSKRTFDEQNLSVGLASSRSKRTSVSNTAWKMKQCQFEEDEEDKNELKKDPVRRSNVDSTSPDVETALKRRHVVKVESLPQITTNDAKKSELLKRLEPSSPPLVSICDRIISTAVRNALPQNHSSSIEGNRQPVTSQTLSSNNLTCPSSSSSVTTSSHTGDVLFKSNNVRLPATNKDKFIENLVKQFKGLYGVEDYEIYDAGGVKVVRLKRPTIPNNMSYATGTMSTSSSKPPLKTPKFEHTGSTKNSKLKKNQGITSPFKVMVQDCKKSPLQRSANAIIRKELKKAQITTTTKKKKKKRRFLFPDDDKEADKNCKYESSEKSRKKRKKELDDTNSAPRKKKSRHTAEYSKPWLQIKSCNSFPRLPKCLDCKEDDDVGYCRFTMFRKLKQVSGMVRTAGYCTSDDAALNDYKPWIFDNNTTLDVECCKEILRDIGAQFEQLVLQEIDAQKWGRKGGVVAWKRPVLQVREMCDICATTIFNTHWICEECGFGLCLDCFHHAYNSGREKGFSGKRSEWPLCDDHHEHDLKDLTTTEVIPGQTLKKLYDDLLFICNKIGLKLRQLDLLEFSHHDKEYTELHNYMKPGMNSLDILATVANIENHDSERNIFDRFGKIETNSECLWFCSGRMLHIQTPKFSKDTMALFKKEWRKGKPIIVSNVHDFLRKDIWTPDAFRNDFGDEINDIVNCYDGTVIEDASVGQFWEGFEKVSKRPSFNDKPVALLKLKDWPSGDDFKEKLPVRFADMMQALPAPTYTQRDGELNLASRLPEFFAVPDLGPKMYNAYGSSSYPSAGTTNLHLDISDATNVICYVGIPEEEHVRQQEIQDTFTTVDKLCCEATRQRIRDPKVRPGALWHIFDAHDADKMRHFLRRISKERNITLNESSDPIHDQSFYLDQELLERLKKEEGVVAYAICQCLGDAMYIPAGAPHQVLNLHSCIKVAEDFVAPEHITHCFQLTQEFRHLSDYHTNHEDKLQVSERCFKTLTSKFRKKWNSKDVDVKNQIKNIIYHSVKDCLGVVAKHYNINRNNSTSSNVGL